MVALNIIITFFGLTLPGYSLAKALRLKDSLAASFPFSALLICQTVVLLAALNWRINFVTAGSTLALITALFAIIALRRESASDPEPDSGGEVSTSDITLLRISICTTIAMVLTVAFKTTIYPLGGFDTFTRWDALARAMLNHESLAFYPPLSKTDFAIYVIPDGFPPLVASVYWWIYAASGSTNPQLTSLSVTLQLLSAIALTYRAVCAQFGRLAACFTLLTLIASPLFISSFQIGQESGFLVLAVAGQLCFAYAAIHKPSIEIIIAAALFAALGAQAREYGPALAMPGFLILISDPSTRRLAWKYALIAAVIASPWYLRVWMITGNPLYPHALPGGVPVNEGVIAILKYYNAIYSPFKLGLEQWLSVLEETVTGITIAAVVGIPYLLCKHRNNLQLLISSLIIAAIWFWSIGSTCGGVIYSMRVLAPAILLLSITAGIFASNIFGYGTLFKKRILLTCFLGCSVYGILSAVAFPNPVTEVATSVAISKSEQPETSPAYLAFVNQIKQLNIPPTGIFTDSAYLAQTLLHETRFRSVMPWNPEVAFIFTSEISGKDMRERFLKQDIRLIAISRNSLNNALLYRTPLFRDTMQSWSLMFSTDDEWALLSLSDK